MKGRTPASAAKIAIVNMPSNDTALLRATRSPPVPNLAECWTVKFYQRNVRAGFALTTRNPYPRLSVGVPWTGQSVSKGRLVCHWQRKFRFQSHSRVFHYEGHHVII